MRQQLRRIRELAKFSAHFTCTLHQASKAAIELSAPSDLVVVRDAHGAYHGLINCDATVTMH